MPIPAAIANNQLCRPSGVQQVILPRGTGNGTAAQNPMRCGLGTPGNLEILRHHIAGTKGNDAKRHGRAGDSLDHVKDRAVAAADDNGVVAFRYGSSGLWSRGAVFARLQSVDRRARLAEDP